MDGTIYEFEQLPRVAAAAAKVETSAQSARPQGLAEPLVGVIRNPRSHRNKGLVPELDGQPNVLTATPRTRIDLAGVLADFAGKGIDLLVVDGGDGTVRDVLTCGAPIFGANWPPLVVLPKGKTNALAVDLGLPGEWSLPEALKALRQGRIVERRPIVVDQPGSDGGKVMGFILGAGIFTTATQAGQTAHRFGAFNSFAVGVTAAFGVLQALFGFGRSAWRSQTAMRIFTGKQGDEVPHSGHGGKATRYAILVSTLSRFPLGMRPFGRQPQRADGAINFAMVDAPRRRVVLMVPFMLAGWDRPGFARLGVHRGAAEEAVLELDDKFILDGEAFPAGRYRLRMGPKLRFIAP